MKTGINNQAWSASRLSLISFWRSLNTSLDFVFYDTSALTPEERSTLSGYNTPLGQVIIVYPAKSNQPIRSETSVDFVRGQINDPADRIDTVVVSGVGSSALGTASLARNVADYLAQPVAGIVSGFGVADAVTEALGGWFVFGASNSFRMLLANALDQAGLEDHVRHEASHEVIKKHFQQIKGIDPEFFIYGNPASTSLLYILSALGPRIHLLVGHSKGNLCIENALEGLHQMGQAKGRPVSPNLRIVTLGAVIWFDPSFSATKQFLGQIDLLGMLNSRAGLPFIPVPQTWHSLNSILLGYMSVSEALEHAGIAARGPNAADELRSSVKRGGNGKAKVRPHPSSEALRSQPVAV